MGKFAWFWKRVKNFVNVIPYKIINGLSKINDFYKNNQTLINGAIDAGIGLLPGGAFASPIVNFGLNKISKLIDKAKYGIDHPNSFLPAYDNTTPDGTKPIIVPPKRDNTNSNYHKMDIANKSKTEQIQSRLNELKRLNTN